MCFFAYFAKTFAFLAVKILTAKCAKNHVKDAMKDAMDASAILDLTFFGAAMPRCDELAMPAWSDEDVEQIKYERLQVCSPEEFLEEVK